MAVAALAAVRRGFQSKWAKGAAVFLLANEIRGIIFAIAFGPTLISKADDIGNALAAIVLTWHPFS